MIRVRTRAVVALFALVVTLVGGIAVAPPAVAAPPLLAKASPDTGWQTPAFGAWYASDITTEMFSSALVTDLNGDGITDIIAGFPDGSVYGWRTSDGARWFGFWSGPGAVQASPSVVDLNGDGVKEVLVANTNGNVMAVDANGVTRFSAQAGDGDPHHLPGIFSTPVAADVDNDGSLDVVATSWDHWIHVWKQGGGELPGFPVFLQDTSWSSPAVADLDGDGRKEIVFGYDCDGVEGQNCHPARGGYVGVLEPDGTWRPGFPWFTPDQVVWSSPALADLNGDGKLDIVVGTGNMPMAGGYRVYGVDSNGHDLPGWPVALGGRTASSPAIGDLTGDGKPDVAIVADDGKLYAINPTGSILWSRCIANDTVNGCPIPTHGSPSIADVNNDGKLDVLVGGEQYLNVFDNSGFEWARGVSYAGTFPLTAAPSIASVNGETWIVEVGAAPAGSNSWMGRVFAWKTGTALGQAPWPTFRQNTRRTGSVFDEVPPTAALNLPANSATRSVAVSWSGTDNPGGSGVASYDVDTSDNGQAFARWLSNTPTTGGTLWGYPGHTMQVRVRAHDRAGNASSWVQKAVVIAGNASGAPFTAAYAVGSGGVLSGYDSPPANGPNWGYPIARGVAVVPGGGYVLDGWGALHRFGSAPQINFEGYWPGRDITRGVALSPDGTWGYVVDDWGGLHTVGNAPTITNGPYWPGRDVARAIVLKPGTTKSNPGGYILDSWGGVHPFGSAPPIQVSGYWPGWDVVRGIAMNSDGTGYTVDWWGGIHPLGGAPTPSASAYWYGRDVARGIVSYGTAANPAGYVLDSWGGMSPFGSAPHVDATTYGPSFDSRAVALLP